MLIILDQAHCCNEPIRPCCRIVARARLRFRLPVRTASPMPSQDSGLPVRGQAPRFRHLLIKTAKRLAERSAPRSIAGLIGEAGEAFLFAEHLEHLENAGRGRAPG